MAEETKLQQVMEAVTELRSEVEKSAPDREKIEKIEKGLDAFEAKSQALLAEQKKQEAANLALEEKAKLLEEKSAGYEEQLKALEIEIARGGNKSDEKAYRNTDEYKAMAEYVKGGFAPELKAALRTDSDTQGGFLVPMELDTQIVKQIVEISNIRSVARVRTIAGKTMQIPIRTNVPTATYEGESDTGSDSTSNYEASTVTPFRQTVTVPITFDMLMDAAFDMEAEIMSDGGIGFAYGEGAAFVSGTGVKQPEGFLTNASVGGITSGTSATIDGDDLLLLTGQLKVGYNPSFVLNRRTLAFIRTLKSTTGQYLWQPGINGVVSNTLCGDPYLIANDMPDIASGSKSVAYGDFMRGYTIVDRTGLAVIRDEYTQKKQGIVEFTLNRWNTGRVTLPEAIKVLTTKA